MLKFNSPFKLFEFGDNNTLVDVLVFFLKLILEDFRILSYYSEQEFGNW